MAILRIPLLGQYQNNNKLLGEPKLIFAAKAATSKKTTPQEKNKMNQATLTTTGRAAIAKAIASRPLHVAWGLGDEAWDVENAILPSLVNSSALVHEVGRRLPNIVGFVEPNEAGDIIVPKGTNPDGTVEVVRYQSVEAPTPYLYVHVGYDFEDASASVIREYGLFMDTEFVEGLPLGQRYFLPAHIANQGLLLAAQIFTPPINRSAAIRQFIDFVIPL